MIDIIVYLRVARSQYSYFLIFLIFFIYLFFGGGGQFYAICFILRFKLTVGACAVSSGAGRVPVSQR